MGGPREDCVRRMAGRKIPAADRWQDANGASAANTAMLVAAKTPVTPVEKTHEAKWWELSGVPGAPPS